MKRILLSSMIIAGFLTACKKDESAPSNIPSLIGKWYNDSVTVNHVADGQTTTYTYLTDAANYMDFRANGVLYSYSTNHGYNTTTYNMIADNRFVIGTGVDADTFAITNLTAKGLIYTSKAGSYEEIFFLHK